MTLVFIFVSEDMQALSQGTLQTGQRVVASPSSITHQCRSLSFQKDYSAACICNCLDALYNSPWLSTESTKINCSSAFFFCRFYDFEVFLSESELHGCISDELRATTTSSRSSTDHRTSSGCGQDLSMMLFNVLHVSTL